MKPLTLTINNFLSFKKAKIELDDKGLVAVQGKNLDDNGADSNGSGKSSLFIAILWCLFGDAEKKITSDEIVNDAEGKNCFVESLWLDEDTDILYRITRYRKHTKHKNKLRLETLLPGGIWQDETKGKNDLTQAAVNIAIGMDSTVFMASCFASQEDALDIPAMNDTALKSLLENALPFAALEPKYVKFKATYDDLNKQVTDYKSQIDNLDTKSDVLKETLEKAQIDFDIYETSRVITRTEVFGELKKLKKEQLTLDAGLVDVFGIRKIINSLWDADKSLGIDEASGIMIRLEGARKAVEWLKTQLATLGATSDCPTCNQPVTAANLEDHKKSLEGQMVVLAKQISEYETQIETAKANVPKSEKIREKIDELELSITKANDREDKIRNMEIAILDKFNTLKSLAVNPHETTVSSLKSKVNDYFAQKETILEELEILEPKLAVYKNLCDVFSPKGFRYHMLETITPTLNRRTNHYLAMLTDGKIGAHWSTVTKLGSGEYKEAFSIKVNMNGRTNYGSLSGGQKRKVRLACCFALQDMVSDRAAKDVKLWVCDEVDGALDKSGIERLMSLLEEKARTKETVLVISHNSMSDWIANSITVTMKDDESIVSGFLNAAD